MIMQKVLAAAEPYLAGKTVKDLVIGISLISCQMDNGDVGVSYVLRDELPNGCSAFPYAQEVIGKTASEIASWIITGENDLQRAVGASILAAASCGQDIPDDNVPGMPFGIDLRSNDTVGMVGLIKPVASQISQLVGELIVFDKGMSLHNTKADMLYPTEKQQELLPTCDVVILSGTTTINGSIDDLLEMCGKARAIVLVGASTPMFPMGWKGSSLTHLAGSWWDNNHKKEIFKLISLAGGIRSLEKYMRKKAVAVACS
jgi:uncharacterized protein